MASTALVARAANALTRIFRPQTKQTGYPLSVTGGWIPSNWPINWWQCGADPLSCGSSAIVYACIAAYAQTVAMLPGTHWQSDGKGGRTRVTTSALSRVLRKPNSYQSSSDFFLYLTECLYREGAAFGLAIRNNRFEISEIHLMDPRRCFPRVDPAGALYYTLSGNEIVDRMFAGDRGYLERVPARDVLNVRLPDPNNPLLGMAPLEAALTEIAMSNATIQQALAFTQNQSRPSGVIETDFVTENKDQIGQLRASWNDQTTGANAGGTPILTHGMRWKAAVSTSRDAQLAEILQISDQRIATVYRVPLELLSVMSGQSTQSSTETLMGYWVASGLGFATAHIEDAFGRLFALAGQPEDYLELDMAALLRANFKDRIEGLARGVQGGIFAPNEARALEDLPAMPFGDEPRVQQQVVPLSAWSQTPPATPAPDAAPPAAGEPSAEDNVNDTQRTLSAYRARRRLDLAA